MQRSFFPDTISIWNALPDELKMAETTEDLKEKLRYTKKPIPPYSCGTRKGQILHARLRLKCSNLNCHLAPLNLSDTTMCTCGEEETVKHFLLSCKNYADERRELFININADTEITGRLLLYGSGNLNKEENENIFASVQNYLISSERFN